MVIGNFLAPQIADVVLDCNKQAAMNTLTIASFKINKRVIALIAMLLLSGFGMFGQEVKNQVVMPQAVEAIAAEGDDDNSMELVGWLLATKQSQVKSVKMESTISTNATGKKNFINNGLTPNRILSRTFLKKAIAFDSTIA